MGIEQRTRAKGAAHEQLVRRAEDQGIRAVVAFAASLLHPQQCADGVKGREENVAAAARLQRLSGQCGVRREVPADEAGSATIGATPRQ